AAPVPAPGGRGARPDGGHGHARRNRGQLRRPGHLPRRRPHRRRDARRRGRRDPRLHEAPGSLTMLTATIRGMLAHKLRLALTTASIALGVAFLAGTFVLTDTMGLAFSQLFGKVSAGPDAVVRTEAPYSATEGIGTSRGPIAASVLSDVAKVDGVRTAEGAVTGCA